MFERLNNYDWANVFGYAGEKSEDSGDWQNCIHGYKLPRSVVGNTCELTPFTRNDVKRIVGLVDGCNDEEDWVGVFELLDGRYAFLKAGCDYTGWDCQAGGDAYVATNIDHLVQFGMDEYSRARLGFGYGL